MTYTRWQGPDRPLSKGVVVTRLRLEADQDAPARARAALAPLRRHLAEDVFERAELLASEVVTNAVRYSGSDEVRLDIWRTAGSVAVVASDDGPGFEPRPRRMTDPDREGGFGLPLLDTLSEAWGSGTDTDSWVWFECRPRVNGDLITRFV